MSILRLKMETSSNLLIFQNIRSRELNGFRVRKRPSFADDGFSRIGAFDYGLEEDVSPPMALSFCKMLLLMQAKQ
ncbi:hypothetical protein Hanom_Chr02g00162401 [Helianthus anomalus]